MRRNEMVQVVLTDPKDWCEIARDKGLDLRAPTRADVRDLERIVAEWLRARGMVREVSRV